MYGQKTKLTRDGGKSKVRAEIDANLKRVYADALKEDVPDRLKQLLAELKKSEAGK